jgi:peptidase S46-like protein
MKKIVFVALMFSSILSFNASAGEGMWIPLLLEQLNEAEMKDMGMKISAEDIYSINHSSLKDAIVLFGGGCTAEVVSDQGLLLTNHHCGYGSIQKHSSLDNNYLTNGFWAMNQKEELENPGLKVTFLVSMEDVTQKVLLGVDAQMNEKVRDSIIKFNIAEITKEAIGDSHFKASIRPFYYGNEFYMFITETFEDIRLVGAPPSNIGKFGGDTDNWMWPRHTGDFSIFRIYADSNNLPAKYSENNVPYKPKYHIPVSLDGYQEGDFTFVFGFPGRTQEYLPSHAIEMITQVTNPAKIQLREKRINTFKSAMNQDDLVRIQYSTKLARAANYWKKMIGENKGIKSISALAKKKKLENEFQVWAATTPEYTQTYAGILPAFEEYYQMITPYQLAMDYVIEAGLSIELVGQARKYNRLVELSKKKDLGKEELDASLDAYRQGAKSFFKDYYQPIDKEVMAALLKIYHDNVAEAYRPLFFKWIDKKFGDDYQAMADYVFEKSIFASQEKTEKFLNHYKKGHYKKIEKDPAYKIYSSLISFYLSTLYPKMVEIDPKLDSLQRLYMKGLMLMQPDMKLFADANSTLRVHYGNVAAYVPKDGVDYNYFTTLEGIMEKENPDIYDYVVEDKLKELYQAKDYGRYADKDGKLHVGFIATNHTTGGNSGSPAMNANGELIGINFDRNWEGTMSDLMYDPDLCRNIMIDIRYLLFVVDKYAGAGHLIEEMTIVGD